VCTRSRGSENVLEAFVYQLKEEAKTREPEEIEQKRNGKRKKK